MFLQLLVIVVVVWGVKGTSASKAICAYTQVTANKKPSGIKKVRMMDLYAGVQIAG
jgi:hypothetical protein